MSVIPRYASECSPWFQLQGSRGGLCTDVQLSVAQLLTHTRILVYHRNLRHVITRSLCHPLCQLTKPHARTLISEGQQAIPIAHFLPVTYRHTSPTIRARKQGVKINLTPFTTQQVPISVKVFVPVCPAQRRASGYPHGVIIPFHRDDTQRAYRGGGATPPPAFEGLVLAFR